MDEDLEHAFKSKTGADVHNLHACMIFARFACLMFLACLLLPQPFAWFDVI